MRFFDDFSYKEQTDGETDSDDIIEMEADEEQEKEEENKECIERILDHRRGKKGGRVVFALILSHFPDLLIRVIKWSFY